MDCQVIEANDQYTYVKFTGRLDIAGAAEVEPKFTANALARQKHVIVDMSDVDFIASRGMRTLLSAAKELKDCDAQLVLVNPQPMVKQGLQMAAIDRVTPIVTKLDKAKEKLGLT